MNGRSVGVRAVAICLLFLASVSTAATQNYGDYYGSNPGEADFLSVSETSTSDSLPLFGSPIRFGNQLLFTPTNFSSQASNGSTDTTSSVLSMTLVADTGYYLEKIAITENGTYSLTSLGANTWADATGSCQVDAGSKGTYSDTLSVTPTPPYSSPPGTSWTGSTLIDLTGLQVTQLDLTFEDILKTSSDAGTSAFIGKNVVQGAIGVQIIPEPATVGLLALGGTCALLRRRRR